MKPNLLITNPTKYAIALYYDENNVELPLVLAKGMGSQAEAMIKAAQESGIPIMQNVPLAHALYDLAEVANYIPSELIAPVAEVIHWVYEMRKLTSPK